MPVGPTYQEFWPEYNVGIFAWKLVDHIFKRSKNQMEKSFARKKKISIKFCSKMPLGPAT